METENRNPLPAALQEGRRTLLHRVAASAVFQKSNRLRELLLFLGEQRLRNPERAIREQDIGVEVFGRPANYDTSQDTLVRVQASQLRKKLQQYFDGEGRGEETLLELPKGSYSLRFRARQESDSKEKVSPANPVRRRIVLAAPGVIAAVLALVCLLLGLRIRKLERIAEYGMGRRPAVNRLWRGMFGNGQPTHLILADGNLVVFQDAINQMIGLGDYQFRALERLAQDRIQDPSLRTLALKALSHQFTSIADAELVRRISLVCGTNEIAFDTGSARNATITQINQHNTILTGSRRGNPWLSLFEDQLNFTTVFEEEPRKACFVNRTPARGEQPRYCGIWSRLMYCRVVYLPNAKGTGHVLLISGTDVLSTEAGGELVTNESWVGRLGQALGVGDGQEMPYFEALIEGKELNNTAPHFELVAVRRR